MNNITPRTFKDSNDVNTLIAKTEYAITINKEDINIDENNTKTIKIIIKWKNIGSKYNYNVQSLAYWNNTIPLNTNNKWLINKYTWQYWFSTFKLAKEHIKKILLKKLK